MNAFVKEVIDALSTSTTLDAAFRKLEQWQFPLIEMEPIAQDEFSHDIVIPFPNHQEFLVIGTT